MAGEIDGLEVLDVAECMMLLRTVPIGRIGLSINEIPTVLPVNFLIDAERNRVVIRSTEGVKYHGAIDGVMVAFEADEFDKLSHAGWSVVVKGRLSVVTDPFEVRRLSMLPLRSWAGSDMPHWLTIDIEMVTGRRVAGWHHPKR